MRQLATAFFLILSLAGVAGDAAAATPDHSGDGEVAFRALYKELVETNTSHSVGSCTLAAQRMAAHLKTAGYPDTALHLFSVPEYPKDGGLVAELTGSDPKLRPVLLLAHLDVVEANRADWVRDPFSLIEEGGYFYGRGASDDKAMAAVFTDTLARYRQEGYQPRRTIRMALTCGEETSGAFNGASWLSTYHKDWIDAGFAINEGGHSELDAQGKPLLFGIEAAEKVYQDYTLVATNPGGHSSQPVPDNAIYELSAALLRVSKLVFPVQFNDVSKVFFTRMASITGGEMGSAMQALVRDPADGHANAVLSTDKRYNSMLRTTCVATMLAGGHAKNALPQRAEANVNCRIFPGVPVVQVRDAIVRAINDPQITVTIAEPRSPATPSPALDPAVVAGVEKVVARLWPGVPVLPTITTGATDGIYTTAAGIPTYGITGMFSDPDNGNIHGLNERIRVQSLLDGRRFQYQLIKLYTSH